MTDTKRCQICSREFRAGKVFGGHMSSHRRPADMNRWPKRTLAERFWEKVDKLGECWVWTAHRNALGYGVFGANRRSVLAHRMAWTLERGPIPNGLIACHHCDNPACVRPDHIFLGTHRDNAVDMTRKGRHHAAISPQTIPRGEAHWTKRNPGLIKRGEARKDAKLTNAQVQWIRSQRGLRSQASIARELGVSCALICLAMNGRKRFSAA